MIKNLHISVMFYCRFNGVAFYFVVPLALEVNICNLSVDVILYLLDDCVVSMLLLLRV